MLWTALFLAIDEPLKMILAGGIAVAILLFVVVFAAWVFRYRRLDKRLHPGRFYDAMLWLSFLALGGVAARAIMSLRD